METRGSGPASPWKRFVRFVALGAFQAVLVMGVLRLVENHRGTRAWARYQADLEEEGITLPALLQPAPIGDHENFAAIFAGKSLPDLQEISRAATRPYALFQIRFDPGEPIETGPLETLLRVGQRYRARALASLNQGLPDKACDDLVTLLRLAHHTEAIPLLAGAETEAAILNLVFQPLWQGLAMRQWPESALKTVQEHLEAFDLIGNWPRLVKGEQLHVLSKTERMVQRRRYWREIFPKGWLYQNGVSTRSFFEVLMPLVVQPVNQTVVPHLAEAIDYNITHLVSHHPYRFLAAELLPQLAPTLYKMAYTQATLRQAALACALERYRIARQEYPRSLRHLIPRYLRDFPVDPMTGGPMRYSLTEDGGYQIYSIGWNMIDDGGAVASPVPENPRQSAGDWVWRMPGFPLEGEEHGFVKKGP